MNGAMVMPLPKAGDALPVFRLFIDPEAMKVWAVALHDPNPIHLDVEVVRAQGLGDRVINQGPANVAYLINMLQRAFPGGAIEDLRVRFVDNVYGGEHVDATGTVLSTATDRGITRVACDLLLTADSGRPVITGSATMRLG
ncbi:MAG: MaoC family dehydratase [Janthinobacterium lividum]